MRRTTSALHGGFSIYGHRSGDVVRARDLLQRQREINTCLGVPMPEVPTAGFVEMLEMVFHAEGDSTDVWDFVATETHCIVMAIAMLIC
jgi:hypothetical protein